ncbi:MAG TPA: hypothetical protein VEX18_07390 [Polyangiaceae bacterium]|nr:hypothetical protein [Polyangiaceae bacterium]
MNLQNEVELPSRSLSSRPPARRAIGWAALLAAGLAAALLVSNSVPTLRGVQGQFVWRVVSGGLLLAFVGAQWLLLLARTQGFSRLAKRLYLLHSTWAGAGCLLLLLHAQRFGHGYTALLGAVFLAVQALGALHSVLTPINKAKAASAVVLHIGSSVALVLLIGYHIWTALYFE